MAGRKKRRRKAHRQSQRQSRSKQPDVRRAKPAATLPIIQSPSPSTSTQAAARDKTSSRGAAGPSHSPPIAGAVKAPVPSVAPVTPSAAADAPPILRVWSHRNYALFEGGWLPHSITSWMQRVGVTWMAWELSHSNTWVGVIAAADLAPMLVLAPIAGAVVDRSPDPLRQLKLAQLLLLVQAFALAALTYAGVMTIELLFVLSLVTGILNPFTSAARQLILAGSVPRADFAPAIALDSALFQASRFVGPAIAAVMIGVWGVSSTFMVHVGGCVIILAALSFIRIAPPDKRGRISRGIIGDIAESIRYARGHGAIWPLFLLLTLASTLLRPVQDLLPGFASKVFAAGPQGLGWLASSMGVGAMCSATFIALRGRVEGLSTWAIFGALILIAATLGFVSTDKLWLGLVFACLSAFGLNTMSTSIQTITQSVVSDGMRGRVMSLYALIFRGMPAIGALVLGVLADRIGLQSAFAAAAALSAVVWLLVAVNYRAIAAALRRDTQ